MVVVRVACVLLFTLLFAEPSFSENSGRLLNPQQVSSGEPAGSRTIELTVPIGTLVQITLDREVRLRKVGQVIHGRVMEPVYVFDQLVIPVGTVAMGRVSAIEHVSAKKRTLSALNADFSPAHEVGVAFDELILPGDKHMSLQATVASGSGQVIRLTSASEHKKNVVKDSASQKMDQVKAQWQSAMKQIETPDKMHRLMRYGIAQFPLHPQYIDAGTLFSAELTQPLEFGRETVAEKTLASICAEPPPGSLVHAILLTPLDSASTAKGADVEAVLSQPLIHEGRLILPVGTRLKGPVLQVRPARYFHRNGQLRIAFRQIVLPDGAVQTVDTSVKGIESGAAENVQLDSEGGAKATSPVSRYVSTGASVSLALVGSGGRNDVGDAGPAAGGTTGFKLIGLIVGLAFRSHSYGILMSAYGGGRSIYTNFLGRGREIVFQKNTVMQIGIGNRTSTPMPGVQ
jgi:hypothetical protein